MLVVVRPIGGPDQEVQSGGARFDVPTSHDVLVQVRLAVFGCCEGTEPGYRERVAEHHRHVHPLGPLGPPSLLLLELFDALRLKDRHERGGESPEF